MSESTLDVVRQLAADVFALPLERIDAQSSPATVPGWDSVQHLSLVLAVEERFQVQLAPEDYERTQSVGGIAELIAAKLAPSNG